MAWDFSTEPDFQAKLDWIRDFVRDEVDPLDLAFPGRAYEPLTPALREVVDPLKQRVRDQGLWACHLGPELGGQGFGQLKLALMNEILGTSHWAPVIFGAQAPDTGNAEIIAHYGTAEQKTSYLQPLLDGEVFSSFSMTEPHAGSDPTMFTTRADRDGDDWVINGEKFFSSNFVTAAFAIVMAVTDPEADPYRGMSMFLVPTGTDGIEILRNVGLMGEPEGHGMHAHVRYHDVRVPADALLGGEGQAFVIAQTRLGGGRVHHAMRTVGLARRALDLLCERALSRRTQGERLADKQLVQAQIAESYAQIEQFRLLVLHTAWLIDQRQDYKAVRKEIALCKVLTPKVLHDVVYRAMHLHGALGVSNEMPFGDMLTTAAVLGLADGPTEVHEVTVAREVLKGYEPSTGEWPSAWLPRRRAEARRRFAEILEADG
jgi:acyl-CoA dehydrogenase